MQPLGGMCEQVPVLVDRAAPDRHAVPDGGDGLVEPRRAIDLPKRGFRLPLQLTVSSASLNSMSDCELARTFSKITPLSPPAYDVG